MKGFPLFALATIANIAQGTANPLKAPRISPAKALKEETQEPGPSNQNQKQAPKLSACHMPTKACKDATQQNLENAYHISDAESDSNPGHIVPTPPLGASSPPTSRQGVQMPSSGSMSVEAVVSLFPLPMIISRLGRMPVPLTTLIPLVLSIPSQMFVILIGTLKLTWIGPSITMIAWIVGTLYPVATLPEVIGDGKSINFWCNTWLPHMAGEALNLPGRINSSLKYTVSDFLHNGSWNLTPFLQICALNLVAGIVQMDILISHRPNELIWEKYDSRSLTLKIAFNFLCGNDILLKRGCTIVSQCNLCCSTLKPPSTSFFSAICSFSLELAFK
ncbi:hypothetical protein JHK87_027217 [Glycine soja]|nr:hypothetical protein JHK87_027217 [Glycine soja]